MFHNDVQTQLSNKSINQHPIDRILKGYLNTNNQMNKSQSNIRKNNYNSETKYIIQRQRVIRSFLNKSDENEVSRLFCLWYKYENEDKLTFSSLWICMYPDYPINNKL